jgi:hypothetical protein
MKTITMLFLFVAGLMVGQVERAKSGRIALPNPGLMRCESALLWQDEKGAAVDYPLQISMDHFDKDGCPQGVMAIYDKTISFDDVKEALDRRYARWASVGNDRIKVYRVEPEKFAIQVTIVDESLKEPGAVEEKGMTRVIYLTFGTKLTSGP